MQEEEEEKSNLRRRLRRSGRCWKGGAPAQRRPGCRRQRLRPCRWNNAFDHDVIGNRIQMASHRVSLRLLTRDGSHARALGDLSCGCAV